MVAFLYEQDEFDDYEEGGSKGLGAIKLACGDKGLDVARHMTWAEVPEKDFIKLWNSLRSEARPNDFKIGSLIRRAEQLGKKFHVRKSSEATSGVSVVTSPTSASGLPPGATIGGLSDQRGFLARCIVDGYGNPMPIVANAIEALHDPVCQGALAYDEMRRQTMLIRSFDGSRVPRPITDNDDVCIQHWNAETESGYFASQRRL